jgi:hypothetical protein
MRRTGEGETLAGEVRAELARLSAPSAGAADIANLVELWPACVGPAISANAWPARFARDGTLVVHVSSSTWAFELTQLETEIRGRLVARSPAALKFVPGPLPEPEEPLPKVEMPHARPTVADQRRAAEIAAAIGDPSLRELVARAALASLAGARGRPEATGASGRLT